MDPWAGGASTKVDRSRVATRSAPKIAERIFPGSGRPLPVCPTVVGAAANLAARSGDAATVARSRRHRVGEVQGVSGLTCLLPRVLNAIIVGRPMATPMSFRWLPE